MTSDQINDYVQALTNQPWYGFPAHYDERRRTIWWGSAFIAGVNPNTVTKQEIYLAFEMYIDRRNEHVPDSMIQLEAFV